MPDITESLTPNSAQLDAVDLTTGPRDFTITKADYRPGTEQPVTIHLAEFPRPWKPGKNMRRVMSGCLTPDTDNWPGHRIRLFCNSEIAFGGMQVGGIQVSHMDIPKPIKVPIILTKGKSTVYEVKTLPKAAPAAPEPTPEELAAQVVAALKDATTEADVTMWGNRAASRNLLDVQVDAQTVKSHVTARLAEVADDKAAE